MDGVERGPHVVNAVHHDDDDDGANISDVTYSS